MRLNITSMIQQFSVYIDSLSGGNEYVSAVVVGLIGTSSMYAMREVPLRAFKFLKRQLSTSMIIESSSASYFSIVKLLVDGGVVGQSRSILLLNGRWGHGDLQNGVGYGRQFFIFRNRLIHIDHSFDSAGASEYVKKLLMVTVFGRSHAFFNKMIDDSVLDIDIKSTKLYSCEGEQVNYVTSIKRHNISNVILSQVNLDSIINRLNVFVKSKSWYEEHNVPYQLGILLYGPPGTGKTSLIKAIADHLNRDIVFVEDANSFSHACKYVKSDQLIVAEEADKFSVMTGLERDMDKDGVGMIASNIKRKGLGSVLTAMDGVLTNSGRVLIMTTNHPDRIDDAVKRPGRIDISIELSYLTVFTFNKLIFRFFGEGYNAESVTDKLTPATVQDCILRGLSAEQIINKFSNS